MRLIVENILADDALATLDKKYTAMGCEVSVYNVKPNGIYLAKVVIPKEDRGKGVGTQFMRELIKIADDNKRAIILTPSNQFGSSIKMLDAFYKKFGFQKNSGNNKDFNYMASYIRNPK